MFPDAGWRDAKPARAGLLWAGKTLARSASITAKYMPADPQAKGAVFLSYASQDAVAAKRICEALRAVGVEVWFDQSELVGGDQWDAKIRKQIKDCALFVPIISAATQARREGYFRLEWRLAVERMQHMDDDLPFLLPVVIDDTTDAGAFVPDKFRAVQWTRLSVKDTPESLAARVGKLLGGGPPEVSEKRMKDRAGQAKQRTGYAPWMRNLGMIAGLTIALVYALRPMWQSARRSEPKPVAVAPVAVPISEARELVAKARRLFFQLDETKDDLKLAEELLKQAITKDRSDAEVWAAYAQLHQRFRVRGWDLSDERREQAREATQLALRLDPQSFEARFAQATGLMIGGVREMAEKEAALRALLRERPSDQRVLRALGALLRNVPDRHEEANRIYEQSAALPGGDPLALFDKAMNLWFDGRASEAERALGAAIAQRSFAGARLMELFFALSLRGDRDRAYALLQGISQSEMEDTRACIFAYLVHRYRDEPDLALAAVRSSPRDWLDDYWYHGPRDLLAGDALFQAGRPDAAAVEWRAALKVTEARLATRPNDLTALGSRLTLFALLGDTAEARKLLPTVRQMVRADQSGVLVPVWFSRAYLALGERTEAMRQIAVLLSSKLHAVYLTAADLRFNPIWAPLRGDLEFARLIAEADRVEQADDAAAPIPRSTAAAPLADEKSVAVLAFANLSDDKGNEYFSDGISEELLNVLAKVPGLKVTARTSSFHFKGKDTAIKEIARQLGVAYVVEGSVRKQGDKVRITAQLIKAADGFHVWSDTFTRDLKDIFAVQDEIAGLIAKSLQLRLAAGAKASVNPEAFELYMQARQAINRRDTAGFARAEELLTRAIELEPGLARAHAAMADVWTLSTIMRRESGFFGQRNSPVFAPIERAIDRALAFDPDSAEARTSLGFVRLLQWKPAEAEHELRRAVALNPNYTLGHHWLGACLTTMGEVDEGVAEYQRAVELDPFSFRILDNYGSALNTAGRSEEALLVINRSLELQPKSEQTLQNKIRTLLALNRLAEAETIIQMLPENEARQYLARLGHKAEAEAALAKVSGRDRIDLLLAYDRIDEWLDAVSPSDIYIFTIRGMFSSPELDAFRHDPRFQKLIATLGITEAHARVQAWRAAHPPEKPAVK
jgi:TolB-like protein/Tfp pilus assembly protein PilF